VLLQAIAFSHAEAHANQHVLGGDAAKETHDDAFRADVAAQNGAPTVREPGMRYRWDRIAKDRVTDTS